MFKRSFISLVFSPGKLQILKLDRGSGVVKKYVSVPIPNGVIVGYQVKRLDILTELIKKTWSGYKWSGRTVGIVIPEFSTYTKSLSLPKLAPQELDEAVRWQSQDFLPASQLDMVLDWRIIGEDKDEYQILAAAVRKDILAGFVKAVSQAGLLPLVVETPALSLVRLTKDDLDPKILIYVNSDETIVVISKGESILATSVVSSISQAEIVGTAVRIANHYQGLGVKKVFVGGVGLAQEFLSNLQSSLKLPVHPLEVKLGGLNPQEIQEYLVAVSLQLKDPAEPESTATVNLLPEEWAKHYKSELRNVRLWTLSLTVSSVIWACFLGTIVSYLLMSGQKQTIAQLVSSGISADAEEVNQEVQSANELSKKVIEIYSGIKSPKDAINKISAFAPRGIDITSYKLNLEKGEIDISGIASNRNTLVEFKNILEAQDEFSSAQIPISSILGESDIEFHIFIDQQMAEEEVPKLQL